MTPEQLDQWNRLRTLLHEAYQHAVRRGADMKAADMDCRLHFPEWNEVRDGADPLQPVIVQIYSYAFGPSRMHSWISPKSYLEPSGACFVVNDPLGEALKVVEVWHAREMGYTPNNDPDDLDNPHLLNPYPADDTYGTSGVLEERARQRAESGRPALMEKLLRSSAFGAFGLPGGGYLPTHTLFAGKQKKGT